MVFLSAVQTFDASPQPSARKYEGSGSHPYIGDVGLRRHGQWSAPGRQFRRPHAAHGVVQSQKGARNKSRRCVLAQRFTARSSATVRLPRRCAGSAAYAMRDIFAPGWCAECHNSWQAARAFTALFLPLSFPSSRLLSS